MPKQNSFIEQAASFFVKAFSEANPINEESVALQGLNTPVKETKYEAADIILAKSVDIEKRQFTAVVLRPYKLDSDNNFYSTLTVEKACHDFNEHCRTANLQHLFDTDLVYPAQSYIAPIDFEIEDQQFLKGDWVMVSDVRDDDLWAMCKDGGFTGYSIGCPGKALVSKDND